MDAAVSPGVSFCSECGKPWPPDELAHFGERLICPECKNTYAQKLLEGVSAVGALEYAGFWIRVVAALIDGIILFIAQTVVHFGLSPVLKSGQTGMVIVGAIIAYLVSLAMGATYEGLFISKLGATPGKMVAGLKVVRTGGSPVSVGRAFGRYFAKMISGLILCIGFIMVGFDSEKRGLHDLICDTRVIKARH